VVEALRDAVAVFVNHPLFLRQREIHAGLLKAAEGGRL
jgi:hypothetical protein